MDEQIKFRTALAALKAAAETKDRKLSVQEVQDALSGMDLDETQYQMVYAYLAGKGIHVEGAVLPEVEKPPYTDGEQEFLKQYRKDLKRLKKQPADRLTDLYARAADGEAEAKRLLTEHYMDYVLELAEDYAHGSLPIQDLVQEGSLGLMVGIDTLGLMDEALTVEAHLEHEIRRALQEAIREQEDARDTGAQITEKLNKLADSVTKLTEDLGREVTPDELSMYLDMPLEQIEDLLRIAGETIEAAEKSED